MNARPVGGGTASPIERALERLQDAVSSAIARRDWPLAVAALRLQGDVLAALGMGLAGMSFRRAERIAGRHGLAGAASASRGRAGEMKGGHRDQ